MKTSTLLILGLSFADTLLLSQNARDTFNISLNEINIVSYRTMNGIGHIQEHNGEVLFTGKKNEVIIVDTLEANKAINNTRQIIGRVPGLTIAETESAGFTANGIGFRGINPYQSIETNTRQNNYNISADIYGYNESYYLPPMEAVQKIIFLRGAAGLAFGPQIGGMINYELNRDAQKPIEIQNQQTIGNYGLYSNFTQINGKLRQWQYYSFLKYRRMDGYRQNSQQTQWSGLAGIQYHFSNHFNIGLEYTMFRNLIQMPGGLNDSLFHLNPQQSLRSRNWLQSPWNILSAYLNYTISPHTQLHFTSSASMSARKIVWRNEDIPPQVKDTIGPNYTYEPREVVIRTFSNLNNELRLLHEYPIQNYKQTFTIGLKYAYAHSTKKHDAEGTTKTDPDFTNVTEWGGNMNFFTTNIAAYVENNFNIKDKLFITPGIRLEYLSNTLNGYDKNKAEDSNEDKIWAKHLQRTRQFLLSGMALQYNITEKVNLYTNFHQSYRPITYSDLTPFGTIAKIDPKLKDPSANNMDFGFRGVIKNILNFDISVFYLYYKNKIGTVIQYDTTAYYFRTNTGSSEHKGIESYVEINVLNGLIPSDYWGKLSIYNSYGYIQAHYVAGPFAGKLVEYAPQHIERCGINYLFKNFSFNIQYSYTSQHYADAANTAFDRNGIEGIIPAYSVIDASASLKINSSFKLSFGVNNLSNTSYFTIRTDEYPGPGILPAIGRTFYFSLRMKI